MVVSIAYRLGLFGSLYVDNASEEFQGNWGIQDIIGAMTWSQFYAPKLGGDTNDAALSV